jgi:hypothetical protein
MKEALIEIIKWVRESVRPVFVIFFLCSLMLFTPSSWLAAVGIVDSVHTYRFITSVLFAGSFIWLATFPIEHRYLRRRKVKLLENLASDEKKALQPYILDNKTIHCFSWWQDGGIAKNLAGRGLLSDTGVVDGGKNPHFAIDPWTLTYLREHPELVDLPKKPN